MKTAGSVSYIPELDGMRALAVLAVLAAHYGLGPHLQWLVELLMQGSMGVWAFFVLSGFLITSILIECRRIIAAEPGRVAAVLGSFYARRALRIFPLYYGTIVLLLIFGSSAFDEVAPWHALFLSNTQAALFGDDGAQAGLVHPSSAHFWSLSVEEQFYLLWPFCVLLLPGRALWRLTIALLLLAPLARLAVAFSLPPPILLYLPTCVDALGFGALLALWRGRSPEGQTSFLPPALVGIAACIAVAGLVCLVADVAYRPVRIVLPGAAALLFAWAINRLVNGSAGIAGRVLRWPVLVHVGRISYGIYLLHSFTAVAMVTAIPAVADFPEPLRFGVLSAVTIVLCQAIWMGFEHPLNRLKVYFPLAGRSRAEMSRPAG